MVGFNSKNRFKLQFEKFVFISEPCIIFHPCEIQSAKNIEKCVIYYCLCWITYQDYKLQKQTVKKRR